MSFRLISSWRVFTSSSMSLYVSMAMASMFFMTQYCWMVYLNSVWQPLVCPVLMSNGSQSSIRSSSFTALAFNSASHVAIIAFTYIVVPAWYACIKFCMLSSPVFLPIFRWVFLVEATRSFIFFSACLPTCRPPFLPFLAFAFTIFSFYNSFSPHPSHVRTWS